MIGHVEQRSKITSQLLREVGFRLPGRSEHIPLTTKPYSISEVKHSEIEQALPIMAKILLKALEYHHINSNQDFSQLPFIWRFDLLATPAQSGGSNQHDYKMLELNGTRPGGIWLLLKAEEVYKKVGLGNNLWTPQLDFLGNYFLRLARRRSDSPATIALAYTSGYVAEIEMPQLANMLNHWTNEGGYPLEFISQPRDSFQSNNGKIETKEGLPIDIFYENAGPVLLPNGETVTFMFNGEYPGTTLINHPSVAKADNKILMAYLYDENFRRQLSPHDIAVINSLVPPTFFIRNEEDSLRFLEEREKYFFKIANGLRASSGKGVYNGQYLNQEGVTEILNSLQTGELFVAQERIPLDQPWILSEFIQDGKKLEKKLVYADLDPYVFFDGEEIIVNGALCRQKGQHPINVSQGGALTCVRINGQL